MTKKRTHEAGKLVPVTLRKLPDGWHADGGNLYMFVRSESRTWVFRYVGVDRKRHHMGLGSLDTLTLADARQKARELRAKLRDPLAPVDPLEARGKAKEQARIAAAKKITFKQCAEAFLVAHAPKWSNAKHAAQWAATLETYAYKVFGELPVAAVDTGLVLKVIEPIWPDKTETASRLRGRIESVLDWATVRGHRQGDNPARWRGHLDKLLPERGKAKHHAALPFAEVTAFMKSLKLREGNAARALEFAILTAVRSGEVRGADWCEVDLDAKVWTIPAERMKAKREHRVPLSSAAVKLLESVEHREGLIFPGARKGSALSDMSLTAVLRRMELNDITVHGFRSSFRDWIAEKTHYDNIIAEAALAHVVGDKVEAAYRRGDLFEKRAALMADWARYCEKGEERKVLEVVQAA